MPTLLSINNYYYRRGGADIVFLEENQLFEQIDWRVVPFAMHHPENLSTPWSRYFVEEIEYGQQYSWWQKARKLPKAIYSVEARRKLAKLIDDTKPDVAHLHNVYHHISPSILSVLKERNVPTVLTTHDLKIACPAYSMLTHDGVCERCKGGSLYNVAVHKCVKGSRLLSSIVMLESYLHSLLRSYDNVDLFVTPSRFYKKKFVEWGREPSKFVHIPNFVDTDAFKPKFTAGDYFVYFGRLSREKGLATLLAAAAASDVSLKILGTGPDEKQLKVLATKLGGRVEFLGYRSGNELHRQIANSRAVILPSEWYENGPLSVLESYALATPVIGSGIGGIPEFIREGETGMIFEAGSVESLADALRHFSGLPDNEIKKMGRAGRAWVEEEFTPSHYRENLLDVFRMVGANI